MRRPAARGTRRVRCLREESAFRHRGVTGHDQRRNAAGTHEQRDRQRTDGDVLRVGVREFPVGRRVLCARRAVQHGQGDQQDKQTAGHAKIIDGQPEHAEDRAAARLRTRRIQPSPHEVARVEPG